MTPVSTQWSGSVSLLITWFSARAGEPIGRKRSKSMTNSRRPIRNRIWRRLAKRPVSLARKSEPRGAHQPFVGHAAPTVNNRSGYLLKNDENRRLVDYPPDALIVLSPIY